MPTIRCRCGAEIPLVPNLKVMSQAIETHIEQAHNAKLRHNRKAEVEAETVRDDLIVQALNEAAEM
jgi:hypothetical protein